jgi:DNA-binding NarL/FixJ family response regulator
MTKPPTRTQRAVLQRISIGMPDDLIGEELDITRTTVRTHVAAALRRLQVHSRAHAVAKCMREGWIA